MLRKFVIGVAGAMALGLLTVVPAFAYAGGAGATITTSSTTAPPGGSVTVNAQFTNPNNSAAFAGETVTFSFTGNSGCAVTFTPATATTSANGTGTTTAAFGTGCTGAIVLTATDANGTVVSSTVTISGGLPNASGSMPAPSAPLLPIVLLVIGAIVAIASGAGLVLSRRNS